MNKEKRKDLTSDLLLKDIEIALPDELTQTHDYPRNEFQLLLNDLILLALPSPSQQLH